MFKTLVKSWSSGQEGKWGSMATVTGDFELETQPSGRIRLYPGMVDVLYVATAAGVITSLKAWVDISESNLKGYSGFAPRPLELPDNSIFSDTRELNLQNVTSYTRMRSYLELLRATKILDPTKKPWEQALSDWLSPEDTVLLDWADWDLLSRYSLPVRNVPIEIDLLSELKNERGYYSFSKGDIFGVRTLVDQAQDNSWFSFGDAITILGTIVDAELD